MIAFQTLLAIAAIITHAAAIPNPTSSAHSSCSTSYVATYEDIKVALGSSANIPTPELDLDYIGWTVASAVEVAGVTASTLQTVSPPNTIFFSGMDDTRVHSFSVANGVTYMNLTYVYIGCAIAAAAGTPVASVNVPTGCTVQAVGTTLSGSQVSTDIIFVADLNHTLFTFPLSFSKLKSVNFVLTATSATSGETAVDFDNTGYTVYKC